MIAATQIIAESTVPKALAGKKPSSEEDGVFEALCTKLMDIADTEKDETNSEEKQNVGDYFPGAVAFIGHIVALHPGLYSEQAMTEALAGGEAVADILEGSSSSGNKDIASAIAMLGGKTEQADADFEEIMARMPQITVVTSEKEQSSASGAEDTDRSNLCPLENVSDFSVVKGETRGKAEAAGDEHNADFSLAGKVAEQNAPDSDAGNESGADNGGDNKEISKPQLSQEAPLSVSVDSASGIATQQTANGKVSSMSAADAMQSLEQAIFESSTTEKQKVLEIQLDPENLGKLSIKLSMGAHGLTAKINTDNPEAQGIISGQISQLIQKLGDSGIRVEQMDVSCSDMNSGQNQQYSENENARQRFFFGKPIVLAAETTEPQSVQMYDIYSQLGDSVSSVEYHV